MGCFPVGQVQGFEAVSITDGKALLVVGLRPDAAIRLTRSAQCESRHGRPSLLSFGRFGRL